MGGPGKTSPSGGSYGCEGRHRTGSLLFGQASDGPAPASKLFPLLTGEPQHVSRVRGGPVYAGPLRTSPASNADAEQRENVGLNGR